MGVGILIALVIAGGLLYLFATELPELLFAAGFVALVWAFIWAGGHLGFWNVG